MQMSKQQIHKLETITTRGRAHPGQVYRSITGQMDNPNFGSDSKKHLTNRNCVIITSCNETLFPMSLHCEIRKWLVKSG